MIVISDASYKSDDMSIGGVFLLSVDNEMKKVSPLYWKVKQIECVCQSSKDAKTLSISRMVDDVLFAARQIELLLYGEYKRRIPIKLYTD